MAKKMNTVAKGDIFEKKVFVKFKELLEQDMLGLSSRFSKIFAKKLYAGHSGSKIVFDIAIESYHADSDSFSHLTLFECKDYSGPVQVEAIRDFSYRIKDAGAHKGYFITSGHFQEGVLNVARQEKIGLARMDASNSNVNWTLRRIGKDKNAIRQELRSGLISAETPQYPFIAMAEYEYYPSLFDFITKEITEPHTNIDIPYRSEEEIMNVVSGLTNNAGNYSRRDTTYLMQILSSPLGIKLIHNQQLPNGELGKCDFAQKIIYISSDLSFDSPRWRFTLAHEIGHFVLHGFLYDGYGIRASFEKEFCYDFNNIGQDSIRRLEIQANIFAAYLLVPEPALIYKYRLLNQEIGIRYFPQLFLDNQPCNIELCETVFSEIAQAFKVSKEVIKYRFLNKGWLTIGGNNRKVSD